MIYGNCFSCGRPAFQCVCTPVNVADQRPKGCICPPTAERTCQRTDCGRKDYQVRVSTTTTGAPDGSGSEA